MGSRSSPPPPFGSPATVQRRGRKVRCPNSAGHRRGDLNPSLHIFHDGAYCFVCGHRVAHGELAGAARPGLAATRPASECVTPRPARATEPDRPERLLRVAGEAARRFWANSSAVESFHERFPLSDSMLRELGVGWMPEGRTLGELLGERPARRRPSMWLIPAWSTDRRNVEALVPRFAPDFVKVGAARPRGLCPKALLGADLLLERPRDPVLLLAGERDWLTALVCELPFVPVSVTTGEGSTLSPWLSILSGRRVHIAYDADAAGKYAAQRRRDELLAAGADVLVLDLATGWEEER